MAQGETQKVTPDLLMAIQMLTEENRKAMLEFAAKLKEPTEEEKHKREEERAKQLAAEEQALGVAKAQEQAEEMRRKLCKHGQMFAGQWKHSWRGVVNSGDNMVRAHCTQCRFNAPIFKASASQVQNGLELEKLDIKLADFESMHKQSFPKGCPRKGCYVCYPKSAEKSA